MQMDVNDKTLAEVAADTVAAIFARQPVLERKLTSHGNR
jgi:electron transfer flavoprotein beta subunit